MSDHALFDPERAVRFTFRVSGANIELLEQRHLAMAVLPSHPLDLGTVQSGFWFELQDSERRAVYRRTMSNPLAAFLEVRPDNPDGPLYYQAAGPTDRIVSIVVPDLPNGDSVVLMPAQ